MFLLNQHKSCSDCDVNFYTQIDNRLKTWIDYKYNKQYTGVCCTYTDFYIEIELNM